MAAPHHLSGPPPPALKAWPLKSAMKEFVEVSCTVQHETPKAILIVVGAKRHWLPKSLIEVTRVEDATAAVLLPEWLANQRGLI